MAVRHGESGLAVVDHDGQFVGLIPPQRILSVLLEEHHEDLARLGGFLRSTSSAREASVSPYRAASGIACPGWSSVYSRPHCRGDY